MLETPVFISDQTHSVYSGWLNNSRMNLAIFEPGTASNPLDFFTNPYAAPGAFNPYFNLCGTDDPKASLGTTETAPPDMALITANIDKASTNVRGLHRS